MVEVAIVVSLVGVLLAVFVPTFVRELRTSKLAEASEQLAYLERLTAAYYAASHRVDNRIHRACLPDTAGPAPAVGTEERAEYDFSAEDAPGSPTWKALGFDPGPTRFRYSFLPERSGCGIRQRGTIVTLRAEGDLDGDGEHSLFERRLGLREDGTLGATGALIVEDRVE